MKKMMFFALLLCCAALSYSQRPFAAGPLASIRPPVSFFLSQRLRSLPPRTRDEYLQRSDNQHTAAMVLLIGGGALFIGGGIWSVSTLGDWGESTDDTPSYVASAGLLCMLGSIPLFLASHRNAKRARHMDASFKMEKGPGFLLAGISARAIPVVSVRVGF